MLQAQDLWKSYGSKAAVVGVSLEVRAGEIVGLLGPNGAGKSTTVAMLCGLTPPDKGTVTLAGSPVGDEASPAKRRIGLVPQDIALYEELSAAENLRFWGRLYGLSGGALEDAVRRALDLVGLADRAKARVKTYSGGLKRRLNLAAGLVHSPDLLLLDEPTVGIDPQARLRILDVVRDQARSGRAVLYTSHYLEEAEQICGRLAIIDHGRVLAAGTVAELRRLVGEGPVVRIRGAIDGDGLKALAARCPGVSFLSADGDSASFAARDPDACSGLVRELFRSGLKLDDLRVQEPNLQSVFLKLTGRELRD